MVVGVGVGVGAVLTTRHTCPGTLQPVGAALEFIDAPNATDDPAGRLLAQPGAVRVVAEERVAFQAETNCGPPLMATLQGDTAVAERLLSVASTVAPPVQESVTRHVKTMSSAAAAGLRLSRPVPANAIAVSTPSEAFPVLVTFLLLWVIPLSSPGSHWQLSRAAHGLAFCPRHASASPTLVVSMPTLTRIRKILLAGTQHRDYCLPSDLESQNSVARYPPLAGTCSLSANKGRAHIRGRNTDEMPLC